MPRIDPLLRYWRHCLADGELSEPQWRDNPEKVPISFEDLEQGKVARRLAKRVVDTVERRINRGHPRPTRPGRPDDKYQYIDHADVAIAPFCLRRVVEHGQSRYQDARFHAPFWLSAKLDRSGALSPHPDRGAWFVRAYLDPAGRDDTIVGELAAMDTFIARSPRPELAGENAISDDGRDPWHELMAWVESFFEAVTGRSIRAFQLDDHETLLDPRLVPHKPLTGASQHLLWLYDTLQPRAGNALQAETPSPLLSTLADERPPTSIDPDPPLDDTVRQQHLGHMAESFGLGASQRECLHALFKLDRGEMLALNGPPGTGKTAWIQSVVASLWVERALEQGSPPIIVATSANNRAVTNILDTFRKVTPDDASGLAVRWLPIVDSYGLFLPSRKQSETTSHVWASPGHPEWSGLPQRIENRSTVDDSTEHYLGRAKSHYKKAFSKVEEVVEHLHEHLRRTQRQVTAILAAGERLRSLRKSIAASSPEDARERLLSAEHAGEKSAAGIESLTEEVDDAVAAIPLLDELLAFLPPIRERRNHRFVRLFQRYELPPPDLARWSYRQDLQAALDKHRQAVARRLADIEVQRQAIDAWDDLEQTWMAQLSGLIETLRPRDRETAENLLAAAIDDPAAAELLLDRTLRRQLFLLAGRYWEGRWLLEMRTLLRETKDDPRRIHRQSQDDCTRRFRRFAMLTPLLVSTVYMLPKAFDYYVSGDGRPLVEGIDLMIVEEAGQVAPELGGALFHLAQRAVVLGDIFQIEPIWNVGWAVDDANRQRHDAEGFDQEVFHSSRGSLMGVARTRTRFTTGERYDGLWLREHRRCVPDVIAYCQDLVSAYRDMLEPYRSEISDRTLPALGWAHVRSEAKKNGGSLSNLGQAIAIADWIKDHREKLEWIYGEPIERTLGIVTPYRAQIAILRHALADADVDAALDIGTVHTFQGGELPIMLFSPVVTRDQPPGYFFDRRPNMLNVAVSRAKDSFLVFGDMKIFNPANPTPSGLLAKHLFADEANELLGVTSEPELQSSASVVERIKGLEAHRRMLRRAFEEARDRLLIVSPYLTSRAVEEDDLIGRIATTTARVSIAYSVDMAKPIAAEVARRLEAAGAEVIRLRGFHTKTVAVDDSWFTHGSFNWMSAVRREGGKFQYFEASLRCGPPLAPAAIADIWEEIETGRSA